MLAPIPQKGHRKFMTLNVRNIWPTLYKRKGKKYGQVIWNLTIILTKITTNFLLLCPPTEQKTLSDLVDQTIYCRYFSGKVYFSLMDVMWFQNLATAPTTLSPPTPLFSLNFSMHTFTVLVQIMVMDWLCNKLCYSILWSSYNELLDYKVSFLDFLTVDLGLHLSSVN